MSRDEYWIRYKITSSSLNRYRTCLPSARFHIIAFDLFKKIDDILKENERTRKPFRAAIFLPTKQLKLSQPIELVNDLPSGCVAGPAYTLHILTQLFRMQEAADTTGVWSINDLLINWTGLDTSSYREQLAAADAAREELIEFYKSLSADRWKLQDSQIRDRIKQISGIEFDQVDMFRLVTVEKAKQPPIVLTTPVLLRFVFGRSFYLHWENSSRIIIENDKADLVEDAVMCKCENEGATCAYDRVMQCSQANRWVRN